MQRIVETFRSRAFAAMIGETPWGHALAVLASGLPGAGVAMFVQFRGGPTDAGLYLHGIDRAVADLYLRDYAAINPLWPKDYRCDVGRARADFESVPRPVLERSAYYQDFARPHGILGTSGMVISAQPQEAAVITLNMDSTSPDVALLARARLTAVWPMLAAMARYYRALGSRPPGGEAASAHLAALGLDMALVGQDGRLRHATAPEPAPGAMRIVAGRLVLADPEAQNLMRLMLRSDYAGPQRRVVQTGQGLMSLVRHGADSMTRLFAGPTVSVTVDRSRTGRSPAGCDALLARHALTPAERRVVGAILAGHSVSDIAQGAGLSRETIRSQLKSIYAKTGVNTQAGLVRLLGSLSEITRPGDDRSPRPADDTG